MPIEHQIDSQGKGSVKPDLSDVLTVFVQAAGQNPNYEDCLTALQKQTVGFVLDIVKDFSPIPVALQEMQNRCKTPYYIGVDEDMILYPNSVEKMFTAMQAQDKVALIVFLLRDAHLDERIFGVKIYRTQYVREFPYSFDTIACDAEQVQRVQKKYIVDHKYEIMGEHSPKWTCQLIFERYFNLMEKYKQFGYDWIGKVPRKLGALYRMNPSELNLCALLGAYTSMISSSQLLVREKDFRVVREEFQTLRKLLPE